MSDTKWFVFPPKPERVRVCLSKEGARKSAEAVALVCGVTVRISEVWSESLKPGSRHELVPPYPGSDDHGRRLWRVDRPPSARREKTFASYHMAARAALGYASEQGKAWRFWHEAHPEVIFLAWGEEISCVNRQGKLVLP